MPSHVTTFYNKNFKFAKMGDPAKAQFVDAVLLGDFQADYFEQMNTWKHNKKEETSDEWVNFDEAKTKHGDMMVHLFVKWAPC